MTLNVITGSGVHIEPGMPGQVGQTPPAINIPVPEEATQVSPQSSPETSSLSLRTADHQPAPFIHPTVSFDGQEIKPPTCPPQEAVAGLKRKFQSLLQNLAQHEGAAPGEGERPTRDSDLEGFWDLIL